MSSEFRLRYDLMCLLSLDHRPTAFTKHGPYFLYRVFALWTQLNYYY